LSSQKSDIAIHLDQLSVGYQKGNSKLEILGGLNASIKHGELVCLIGENGVGKSTLLRSIAGVQKPLSGQVFVDNKPVNDYTAPDLARTISLVLTDRIFAGNLTVKEIVALGRHPYTNWLGKLEQKDVDKIDWALDITDIHKISDRIISELSDGQFQKTLIARALAQDGDIIILDEPTAHLDLSNKIIILKLLKDLSNETGKAILIATHEIEFSFQVADKIWIALKDKNLKEGTPEDLVLDGSLNQMINHNAINFDSDHGRFMVNYSYIKSCNLKGDKLAYYWTSNALRRNGWEVINEISETTITIRKGKSGYEWDLTHQGNVTIVYSIEELVNVINNN